MTQSIDTVKTAVFTMIEPQLLALSQVNDVFPYRVIPTKLVTKSKSAVSLSFMGSGREEGATSGKRYFFDFVFSFGKQYSTVEDSMQAAEAALNAIEDEIRDTLDGSANAPYWLNARWQRSTRPDSPPGARDIRIGTAVIRFYLF